MDAPENWREVVGFEGRYEVSDLGRVYSRVTNKFLKQTANPSRGGYLQVNLTDGPRRGTQSVHRIVLAAFVGPCPAGQEALHGSEGPLCNALRNLRYDTRKENVAEALAGGTMLIGEKNGQAKLDEAAVRDIRASSASRSELAARYGVCPQTIGVVQRRAGWSHV